MKKSFWQVGSNELEDFVVSEGFEKYRSKQISGWVYGRYIKNWDEAKNIPLRLREKLSSRFFLSFLNVVEVEGGDGAKKVLFKTCDGNFVEGVFIYAGKRKTFCLSTQVGCKYMCRFCASGKNGFKRNLSFDEITGMFYDLAIFFGKPTNIVFMGMGEPLANIENLKKTVRTLNEKFVIGKRKITVSTVGILSGINEFLSDPVFDSCGLSLSLHACSRELRAFLMPAEKNNPIAEVLSMLLANKSKLKNRLTLEYILIKGITDSDAEISKLAGISIKTGGKVNLIPYNKTGFSDWERPTEKSVEKVKYFLEKAGITVTVRNSAGNGISAACGQLAGGIERDERCGSDKF